MICTDGGIISNCSLSELIHDETIIENKNQILCISINNCSTLSKNFTFLDYMMKLLSNIINQTAYLKHVKDIHFICVEQTMTIFELNKVCESVQERKKLIDNGILLGNQYLKSINNNETVEKEKEDNINEKEKEDNINEKEKEDNINEKEKEDNIVAQNEKEILNKTEQYFTTFLSFLSFIYQMK
jgi:hypothetical protein